MALTRRRFLLTATAVAIPAAAVAIGPVRRHLLHPIWVRLRGRRTVADRVAQLPAAAARVRAQCDAAGVPWPPTRVVLVAIKDERLLHVYAGDPPRRVATFPIRAASGTIGPKLAEGDHQVPEGVYGVAALNPDSGFDVALRVAYPNAADLALAKAEGRSHLGGDIMIHGGAGSVGCLAMGDPAAEELFVLAAAVGVEHVTVVIAPVDLRRHPLPAALAGPRFADRYAAVRQAMAELQN